MIRLKQKATSQFAPSITKFSNSVVLSIARYRFRALKLFDLNDSPGLVRSDAASPLAILDSFTRPVRALKRIQK